MEISAPNPMGFSGKNLIINGNFAVNQRGYASGGTLAASAFGHDRWRDNGGGGLAYTFTAATPDTPITVTAGYLEQVIEAQNVAGGSYVLSWAGSCTVSISYTNSAGSTASAIQVSSPFVLPGVKAGTQITVYTQTIGTIGLVQLEAGTTPTPFERRHPAVESILCQRYFRRLGSNGSAPYRRFGIALAVLNDSGFHNPGRSEGRHEGCPDLELWWKHRTLQWEYLLNHKLGY